MSCAIAPLKYSHPIRKGFARTIGLYFADRSSDTGMQLPIDLSLYSVRFAVKPNNNIGIAVIPSLSIPIPANGWAIATFSELQTTAMSEGLWIGEGLLIKTSDASISHEFDLQFLVKVSIVVP